MRAVDTSTAVVLGLAFAGGVYYGGYCILRLVVRRWRTVRRKG